MSYCDVCGDLYRVEAATGAAAEKGTEGLVAVCTSCGKVENVVKALDKGYDGADERQRDILVQVRHRAHESRREQVRGGEGGDARARGGGREVPGVRSTRASTSTPCSSGRWTRGRRSSTSVPSAVTPSRRTTESNIPQTRGAGSRSPFRTREHLSARRYRNEPAPMKKIARVNKSIV